MKTTLRSIIIILIVIHFAIFSNAENNFSFNDSSKNIHNPTLAFSLAPLYTFQNGFRVDFDIHIAKNNWLIIAPQYFTAQNKTMLFLGNDINTDLVGYGVDIFHKIILKNEQTIIGPYAAYGIRYNNFNYKFKVNNTPYDVTNTRYGFNVIFGYQNAINEKLLLDFYAGCGIQESNLTGDDDQLTENSGFFMNFMNYNYSGPRFLLGFRIGLFLN